MTKAQQTITTCKHEETVKVLIEEFLQQHDDEFFHDFNFNGLKRWISSLLDKADGNKIAVEKPLHNLMQELKKIHAFSCDGIRIEDMHRTHRSRANMQEKYEEAKKYLDKAAHALDLPEGYYYRYVKTEHRSFGDDYQSGNYKNTPCANYDLSKGRPPGDVPRFEGES